MVLEIFWMEEFVSQGNESTGKRLVYILQSSQRSITVWDAKNLQGKFNIPVVGKRGPLQLFLNIYDLYHC